MSDTIVDMPKVTQMLDAGWRVKLFKNKMGSYTAEAKHNDRRIMRATWQRLKDGAPPESLAMLKMTAKEFADDDFDNGWLMTDDFTPEQAITRLAYKVHGEIL